MMVPGETTSSEEGGCQTEKREVLQLSMATGYLFMWASMSIILLCEFSWTQDSGANTPFFDMKYLYDMHPVRVVYYALCLFLLSD